MAIIVNKNKKRRDIALSCMDLLLKKGIKKVTVSEFAKAAGVSKGSIYDYFKNKEDIVFEVIRSNLDEYYVDLMKKINNKNMTTREKIFVLFDFALNENGLYDKKHDFYKEYIGINLSCSDDTEMCQFNNECLGFINSLVKSFIEEGVQKGELLDTSINLISGIRATESGFLLHKWINKSDTYKDFKIYLNTLFDLIEIKK